MISLILVTIVTKSTKDYMQSRPTPPTPMIHIAYSTSISAKFTNSPYFHSFLAFWPSPYFDHEAFLHYA